MLAPGQKTLAARGTTYLLAKLLVDNGIAIGTTKSLFQESEEDGDNDDGLEGLAKHDKEDGDRKDVDRHVEDVEDVDNKAIETVNDVVLRCERGW